VAQLEIKDKTETNMVNLRRTIYLTIMSSAAFEEAVHKLLKLQIPEGQEVSCLRRLATLLLAAADLCAPRFARSSCAT
jgi:hypothetical protein